LRFIDDTQRITEKRRKEGGLMKYRRIASLMLAILVVTALSAAGASAQDMPQQAQSGDIGMGTDVAGSSPVNIESNFDTGNKQVRESFSRGPQPKQPRERGARSSESDPVPAEADPSGGNPAKLGSTVAPATATYAQPATATYAQPKAELPKTGGASSSSLFSLGAGTLLIAAGLLGRRLVK
jgi:LPXTG-motif cell wall-anchored protein